MKLVTVVQMVHTESRLFIECETLVVFVFLQSLQARLLVTPECTLGAVLFVIFVGFHDLGGRRSTWASC